MGLLVPVWHLGQAGFLQRAGQRRGVGRPEEPSFKRPAPCTMFPFRTHCGAGRGWRTQKPPPPLLSGSVLAAVATHVTTLSHLLVCEMGRAIQDLCSQQHPSSPAQGTVQVVDAGQADPPIMGWSFQKIPGPQWTQGHAGTAQVC